MALHTRPDRSTGHRCWAISFPESRGKERKITWLNARTGGQGKVDRSGEVALGTSAWQFKNLIHRPLDVVSNGQI